LDGSGRPCCARELHLQRTTWSCIERKALSQIDRHSLRLLLAPNNPTCRHASWP
jgi:hypothetical protein